MVRDSCRAPNNYKVLTNSVHQKRTEFLLSFSAGIYFAFAAYCDGFKTFDSGLLQQAGFKSCTDLSGQINQFINHFWKQMSRM